MGISSSQSTSGIITALNSTSTASTSGVITSTNSTSVTTSSNSNSTNVNVSSNVAVSSNRSTIPVVVYDVKDRYRRQPLWTEIQRDCSELKNDNHHSRMEMNAWKQVGRWQKRQQQFDRAARSCQTAQQWAPMVGLVVGIGAGMWLGRLVSRFHWTTSPIWFGTVVGGAFVGEFLAEDYGIPILKDATKAMNRYYTRSGTNRQNWSLFYRDLTKVQIYEDHYAHICHHYKRLDVSVFGSERIFRYTPVS